LVGGHTIEKSPRASPDLCTPLRAEITAPFCCDRKARTACAESFKLWQQTTKGVRKGGLGLGLNSPLELDILQKFYYLRKEINCFYVLFAC